MTNREAFNAYVRKSVEKQIANIERMSNCELIDVTVAHPGFHIEENIYDAIRYFKLTHDKAKIGKPDEIKAWLDCEYKGQVKQDA